MLSCLSLYLSFYKKSVILNVDNRNGKRSFLCMEKKQNIVIEKKVSNYEKWCEEWRQKFLAMDKNEILERIPEIKLEDTYIMITQFNRRYGIHLNTGEIVALDDREPVHSVAKLNLYTFIWYRSLDAKQQGEWVSFEKLKGASIFGSAFKNGITDVIAKTFSGHMKELKQALSDLGGIPLKYGDISYELQALPGIPIRIIFWEGDEEFSASANVLFDSSASEYLHIESIVSLAMEGLNTIIINSKLERKGSPFYIE